MILTAHEKKWLLKYAHYCSAELKLIWNLMLPSKEFRDSLLRLLVVDLPYPAIHLKFSLCHGTLAREFGGRQERAGDGQHFFHTHAKTGNWDGEETQQRTEDWRLNERKWEKSQEKICAQNEQMARSWHQGLLAKAWYKHASNLGNSHYILVAPNPLPHRAAYQEHLLSMLIRCCAQQVLKTCLYTAGNRTLTLSSLLVKLVLFFQFNSLSLVNMDSHRRMWSRGLGVLEVEMPLADKCEEKEESSLHKNLLVKSNSWLKQKVELIPLATTLVSLIQSIPVPIRAFSFFMSQTHGNLLLPWVLSKWRKLLASVILCKLATFPATVPTSARVLFVSITTNPKNSNHFSAD